MPLEAGDLLLWDSRLVHAGSVGPGRDLASDRLARASLCVCMGPRARASPAVIARCGYNCVDCGYSSCFMLILSAGVRTL